MKFAEGNLPKLLVPENEQDVTLATVAISDLTQGQAPFNGAHVELDKPINPLLSTLALSGIWKYGMKSALAQGTIDQLPLLGLDTTDEELAQAVVFAQDFLNSIVGGPE